MEFLVSRSAIADVRNEIDSDIDAHGLDSPLQNLAEQEPLLVENLYRDSETVAGQLALAGAPIEIVRMAQHEACRMALIAVQAYRTAHVDYWKEDLGL